MLSVQRDFENGYPGDSGSDFEKDFQNVAPADFWAELSKKQLMLANKALKVLHSFGIVYTALEMRVGKSRVSLKTAELYGAKNVLFVTKKKAISSVQEDYQVERFQFKLTVTNYEQLNNLSNPEQYDFIIVDEASMIGAYPKPSQRAKNLKKIVGKKPLMLLSGTPTPESYSQIYHQFWISERSPFTQSNFYSWAREFVKVKEMYIKSNRVRNYDDAIVEKVKMFIEKHFVVYTQKEAGFLRSEVFEKIFSVKMDPRIDFLKRSLLKDKYYKFKDGQEIVCDSAVKLQGKIHQLSSGTVITEDGTLKFLDDSKARFIKQNYTGQKIAIFYKYQAEGNILKTVFPDCTSDPLEFNATDKVFVCQIQAGAMGINLSTADILIFYNIDFSATNYWQSRARLQNFDRKSLPEVHYLFSENGIEEKVYQTVKNKLDYTTKYFKKDFLAITEGL